MKGTRTDIRVIHLWLEVVEREQASKGNWKIG